MEVTAELDTLGETIDKTFTPRTPRKAIIEWGRRLGAIRTELLFETDVRPLQTIPDIEIGEEVSDITPPNESASPELLAEEAQLLAEIAATKARLAELGVRV
jgi:hypothetical protein